MYEVDERRTSQDRSPGSGEAERFPPLGEFRLGHDVRFVLAAVGGGAVRVARDVARRHLRYLECIAINCDPKVQGIEEFDRRVYLGPESGAETDTGGSTVVGGMLAHAAQPALERLFDGATFVTVVGSLGGGSGTGALPYVLEAAARHSEVLSAFVVKPFLVEGERRAVADRALARLHFVEGFVEKQQRGFANLQILDNEFVARRQPKLPFNQLNAQWADLIGSHIEKAFLQPAEGLLAAARLAHLATTAPLNAPPEIAPENNGLVDDPNAPARLFPSLEPPALLARPEAELTFVVEPMPRPPEAIQ